MDDLHGCWQTGDAGQPGVLVAGESGRGLPHSTTLARSSDAPSGMGKTANNSD